MDWEEDTVHFSNGRGSLLRSGGGARSSEVDSTSRFIGEGLTGSSSKLRFRQFILGFVTDKNRFKYRDLLLQSVNAGERKLEIEWSDLQNYDEQLATALRSNPSELLPLFETAASEAAARLVNVAGAELADRTNVASGGTRAGDGANGDADGGVFGPTGPAEPSAGSVASHFGSIQILLSSQENPKQIRELQSPSIAKLVRIGGIVISAGSAAMRARYVRIECRNCHQKMSLPMGNGFGGVSLPRGCTRTRLEGEEPCPRDPYVVLPDETTFTDQQRVKLQETPENVPTGEMPRSILLSMDRALVDLAVPGMRVSVMGIYSVFEPKAGRGRADAVRTPYLRVVGLKIESSGHSGGRTVQASAFDLEQEEKMQAIARLPNLYRRICASVAPEIFGHDDIKAAIAAQLFGGAPKQLPDGMRLRGDINVLLLGDPSAGKSQLLKFAEKAAPISVYTSGKGSSAAGLTAAVIKDGSGGDFHLEGGAMVLADGGVVCIDEFDKMRVADRVAIHEAMEQQTISIAKAGVTAVLNSRTSVLAAANPAFGRYDDLRSAAENIEFQSTILSRFDLIFIVRDIRSDSRDETIAQHVLALHVRGGNPSFKYGEKSSKQKSSRDGADDDDENDNELLDIDTLKQYVAYARSRCSPRLTREAAELLRNNYVSIRQQMRQSEFDTDAPPTIPITVRQLEAIVRISESLARMTLSAAAGEQHVMEAIRLFKVATLDSANSGMVPAMEGSLRPEFLSEVQAVERSIKMLMPVHSSASDKRLTDDLANRGHSRNAIRFALGAMLRRKELDYKDQRKKVIRIK